MWRISSSWSVRPKRVSTPGIQTTKGEPLSLMRSIGLPHSSMQSRSQARIGSTAVVVLICSPSTKREWSSTRPMIQVLR